MSRFGSLEFNDDAEPLSSPKPELKDDAYFIAQAQTAFERGLFEPALRAYSKAIEYNSKNPTPWAGQVRMLIELDELQEAKVWADKALESFPQDAELLAAKAVTLARAGDSRAAIAFSDAAMEVQGSAPYVWLARGDVLLARREKRADYCFEKALALAQGDWLIHWLASRAYFFYEQFSRALKLAQQALELDARHAAAWVQVGRCQLALGLAGPSQRSFEQARELDPQCAQAAQSSKQRASAGLMGRMGARLKQLFRS